MQNYFTEQDQQLLIFYRIPKTLILSAKYEKLDLRAKILYSIMIDRLSLSMKNKWLDNGKYFIRLSNNTGCELLKLSNKTYIKLKKQLVDFKLLELKRMGLNKTDLLFPLKLEHADEDVYELEKSLNDSEEYPESQLKCNNYISGDVKGTLLEVTELHPINTNLNNTNKINTDNIVNKESVNKNENDNDEIIYKLTNEYRLKGLSKEVCLRVLDEVKRNKEIKNFGGYLRACLENTLYRSQMKKGEIDLDAMFEEISKNRGIPLYNWLEQE